MSTTCTSGQILTATGILDNKYEKHINYVTIVNETMHISIKARRVAALLSAMIPELLNRVKSMLPDIGKISVINSEGLIRSGRFSDGH